VIKRCDEHPRRSGLHKDRCGGPFSFQAIHIRVAGVKDDLGSRFLKNMRRRKDLGKNTAPGEADSKWS